MDPSPKFELLVTLDLIVAILDEKERSRTIFSKSELLEALLNMPVV